MNLRTTHPLLLLAITLIISRILLAVVVWPDSTRLYNGDSWLYEQYALSMIETGSYLSPSYGTTDTDPFADMIRPPGYPLLLALVYSISGAGAGAWVMFALNTGALFVLILLMYRWMEWTGLQQAWPLLFVLVLDPAWWMYSKELITEPWFTPLLMGGMMAVYAGIVRISGGELFLGGDVDQGSEPASEGRLQHGGESVNKKVVKTSTSWSTSVHPYILFIAGGLTVGLATWFKPITLYAPWLALPAILATVTITMRKNGAPRNGLAGNYGTSATHNRPASTKSQPASASNIWRTALTAALLFAAASLLFSFSWQLRNYVVHETLVYTSISAENMMMGHAAFVHAAREGITHQQAQQQIRDRFRQRYPNEAEFSFAAQHEAKMGIAREILRENRLLYARTILRGMAVTMMDPGRQVFERTFRDGDVTQIGLTNTLSQQGVIGTLRIVLREDPIIVAYMVSYMAFLALFFVATLIGAAKLYRHNPLLVLMLSAAVLYLWVLGGPNGYARFRLYIMPLMVMLNTGWFLPKSAIKR